MAGWGRVVSAVVRRAGGARLRGSFATPDARFRSAVTAGFVLASVGAVSLAAAGSGNADDLFGGLAGLFSGQSLFPQYSQAPAAAAVRTRTARPRIARRHPVETRASAKSSVRYAGAHVRKPPVAGSSRVGRLSMCVRLCDGFAFPVGAYHGEDDRGAHEATCRSECPGARTALYVLPGGTEALGDAVDVKTGRTYSQMPTAFHYTTFLEDSCSCHPREGGRTASLLRDFTLRRGDAVMTAGGLKVFHGGAHFPHRQGDFVALSASPDVGARTRATFHAIERASRTDPGPVAAQTPPGPEKHAALAP